MGNDGTFSILWVGPLLMVGLGVLFVVIWLSDRTRTYALAFGASSVLFICAIAVFGLPSLGLGTMNTANGVLFDVSAVALAYGLLQRAQCSFTWPAAAGWILGMSAVTAFFSFVDPDLKMRVFTQNLGIGLPFLAIAWAIGHRSVRGRRDHLVVGVTVVFGAMCTALSAVGLGSRLPQEVVDATAGEAFISSPVGVGLVIAITIVFPAIVVALVAATTQDILSDLQYERDHDPLTNVLNRRGFTARAAHTTKTHAVYSLVVADLDYFKNVNDLHGHAHGDTVIQTFARILDGDPGAGIIVGRLGGEEFAALLPDATVDLALRWAEQARLRLINHAFDFETRAPTITASFGVAGTTTRAPLSDLLHDADRALYAAKSQGRNCSVA